MHMCTMRVISPPPLSGQACCAPSLVLYSEDAVTGTVCVMPPPHIRFVGAGQKSVEKRFKMYEIVDPGHGRTQNFFSGGAPAVDSLGKCRRLKGNLDKSLIRLNFFAILS